MTSSRKRSHAPTDVEKCTTGVRLDIEALSIAEARTIRAAGPKLLARLLNLSKWLFYKWTEPIADLLPDEPFQTVRRSPGQTVAVITKAALENGSPEDAYALLDELERQVGRVARPLEVDADDVHRSLARVLSGAGGLSTTLADALADGHISREELEEIHAQGDLAIQSIRRALASARVANKSTVLPLAGHTS